MRSATPQLASATYQPRFNLKEEAPAAGWRPFLRQGIQVAKRSVQLAREMTVWALVGVRVSKIWKISKILQFFGGLVLGCIKAKFCKKICV